MKIFSLILTAGLFAISLGASLPATLLAEDAETAMLEGDVKAGEKYFKRKCKSCHNAKDAKRHKTGPNLWNIVDQPGGKQATYKKYSKDLKNWDGVWDVANLDLYLTKPKKMFKKTRMSFSGIRKEQDRADVIAYLKTLVDE